MPGARRSVDGSGGASRPSRTTATKDILRGGIGKKTALPAA